MLGGCATSTHSSGVWQRCTIVMCSSDDTRRVQGGHQVGARRGQVAVALGGGAWW